MIEELQNSEAAKDISSINEIRIMLYGTCTNC